MFAPVFPFEGSVYAAETIVLGIVVIVVPQEYAIAELRMLPIREIEVHPGIVALRTIPVYRVGVIPYRGAAPNGRIRIGVAQMSHIEDAQLVDVEFRRAHVDIGVLRPQLIDVQAVWRDDIADVDMDMIPLVDVTVP